MTSEALAPAALRQHTQSAWSIRLRPRVSGRLGLWTGATILFLTVVVALLAPTIAPHSPFTQDLAHRVTPPAWAADGSWAHPLGTDALGRDYASRLIFGTRVSLFVGFAAALLSGLIGTTLGVVGGYCGGRVDAAVMYVVNTKLSLPPILVALALVSVFGGSVWIVAAVLGLLLWDRFAVVARSATQQVRPQMFILAAEALGASTARVILRDVVPNIAGKLLVVASLEMALAILLESGLSFLGLGVPAPTPSWGLMVADGRNFMFFEPYLIVIPGTAIFVLVLGINLISDGLRDLFAGDRVDPHRPSESQAKQTRRGDSPAGRSFPT